MSKEEFNRAMRELDKKLLLVMCTKIRISTRPWMTLDTEMLDTMIKMGDLIQSHELFPKELKGANGKTVDALKLELAQRN